MIHPEDFGDAHSRHWKDAELLYGQACWPNADHLYGLSAECGLKAIMEAQGQRITGQRRKHIQDFWLIYLSFANGLKGARYLLPVGAPFNDWSHLNRYAYSAHCGKTDIAPHRAAAADVRGLVQQATQDGLLP